MSRRTPRRDRAQRRKRDYENHGWAESEARLRPRLPCSAELAH